MIMYVIIVIVALSLLSLAMGAVSFAPWVPIAKSDLKRVLELIEVCDGNVFYDLGSGDGRVMLYLAKKFPQAKFIGIEIEERYFQIACERIEAAYSQGRLFEDPVNTITPKTSLLPGM